MEEWINRYKILKPSQRFFIMLFCSLILPIYYYSQTVGSIETDLETSMGERDGAKAAFEKARDRKANLPKLEEQLSLTENELFEASKRLPDQFIMDKILQKVSLLAKETGTELLLFDPKAPIPSNTAFRYAKLPIKIQMIGSYSQIGTFFDRVVHLKLLVHIRNIKLIATKKTSPTAGSETPGDIRIKAFADLLVYRTLTSREQEAIDQSIEPPPEAPAPAPAQTQEN
jgi:type IV pilus assembly protein PilO